MDKMSLPLAPDAEALVLKNVRMPGKPTSSRWNLECRNGIIHSIQENQTPSASGDIECPFLAPSLCHPHIHLDKCFLLSHPKYADLEIKDGDFAEAMKLTSRFS
jgi:cytosine/adenosine deaminase-related metal-dependent hydrolase